MLGWGLLSGETYFLLSILGVNVGFGEAVALEAATALARGLVVFIPAGLGAQELADVSLLNALGYPEPTALAAAFIAVKRAREVLWVVLGYTVLLFLRLPVRRRRAPAMDVG